MQLGIMQIYHIHKHVNISIWKISRNYKGKRYNFGCISLQLVFFILEDFSGAKLPVITKHFLFFFFPLRSRNNIIPAFTQAIHGGHCTYIDHFHRVHQVSRFS